MDQCCVRSLNCLIGMLVLETTMACSLMLRADYVISAFAHVKDGDRTIFQDYQTAAAFNSMSEGWAQTGIIRA